MYPGVGLDLSRSRDVIEYVIIFKKARPCVNPSPLSHLA